MLVSRNVPLEEAIRLINNNLELLRHRVAVLEAGWDRAYSAMLETMGGKYPDFMDAFKKNRMKLECRDLMIQRELHRRTANLELSHKDLLALEELEKLAEEEDIVDAFGKGEELYEEWLAENPENGKVKKNGRN